MAQEKKVGLVLEGGAMRGMFTAGVLDVWLENDVLVDGVVGVSAGAAFGCNYKSKQIGRTIRYNTKYCRDKRFCSLRSLLRTGNLFGTDFCYRELPQVLDPFDTETFRNNPIPFYVVCTDVETGQPVYRRIDSGDGEDLSWIRASASLPFVSRPVWIDDRLFLDGGMADSIPLRFFEDMDFGKNVVVLTRPLSYTKKPARFGWLVRLLLWRYPRMADAILERHILYNETAAYISLREKQGAVFVIRPETDLCLRRMERDPEKLWTAYREGRRIAEKQLPALREFLEK